jgi:hypothetical protein
MQHVLNIPYGYLSNKFLKCGVRRLAVRYIFVYIVYIYVVRRQSVKGIKLGKMSGWACKQGRNEEDMFYIVFGFAPIDVICLSRLFLFSF